VEVTPNAPLGGWAYTNFQVGSTGREPMVATSCIDCHRDTRMHGTSFAVTFTPDICKSCHDNQHQMLGRIGWTNSNNGFGAAPLSRRVHGVHFGKYVDKPGEIHRTYDYSHVIFPQDVRNCTKCHSESSSWTEKPSRVACLACHDSDYAIAHGTSMTLDFTPQEPFSGGEVETCIVCHGKTSTYAPNAVHSITNPYVPPYPRE
jgi:OmcA/MtrC family decaheme c-type cytochrome